MLVFFWILEFGAFHGWTGYTTRFTQTVKKTTANSIEPVVFCVSPRRTSPVETRTRWNINGREQRRRPRVVFAVLVGRCFGAVYA